MYFRNIGKQLIQYTKLIFAILKIMQYLKGIVLPLFGIAVCAAIIIPIVILLPKTERRDVVVATVNEGNVVGQTVSEGGIFFGIPFSQPPTGEFRWRRPRDPVKYDTKYWNATYKRPGCQQICDQPVAEYSCPTEISEDCLYLNIWIPRRLLVEAKADDIINSPHYTLDTDYLPGGNSQPLAVMVWLYGGNFRNGAGSCVLYDGRNMANTGDVIVVSTNYRVAHFGFLVQGEEGSEESKGNFGLWDQVQTFNWVNLNIANFGGDASKVTLFGQSAGAESIGIHLTSDISKDLFQRTIMQSNPLALPLRKLSDAREFGGRFAEEVGCQRNDMICLRSKTVKELERAYNETALEITDPTYITVIFQPWSPVIDGDVVPKQPIDLFIEGNVQKKPMLLGTTVDEAMIYVAEAFPEKMNNLFYKALLTVVFKEDVPEVLKQYPGECIGKPCDYRESVSELATEFLFTCPQRKAINFTQDIQHWWYIFNQTWEFCETCWEVPLCYDRVCHAAELAYVFNVENLTTYTYTMEERLLSSRLLNYWTNFAKYGNPNGPPRGVFSNIDNNQQRIIKSETTEWPSFIENALPGSYQAMQLAGSGDFVMQQPYKDACDFWDEVDSYADHYMVYHRQDLLAPKN